MLPCRSGSVCVPGSSTFCRGPLTPRKGYEIFTIPPSALINRINLRVGQIAINSETRTNTRHIVKIFISKQVKICEKIEI